jgi:uncharacterized membrane protein
VTAGIIFAMLASATFALNQASMRRGIARGAASQGLYVTIFVGVFLFIVASVISGQLFDAGRLENREWGFLILGGFIHILGGRYCNYRAFAALGSNRAQPIVGMSTLGSVIIAIIFLGETIDTLQTMGIILMMVGPVFVVSRRKIETALPDDGSAASPLKVNPTVVFTPKYLEGYFFGGMAAVLWGAGPVLMRAGLDSTGLGILGGTVAYSTAAIILVFTLLLPGQASGAIKLDKNARGWFLFAAVASFTANVFRFTSLALAPVSVVIPLMRSAVLFTIVFNYFINRDLESFEPRVLGGIAVSLVGAVLLVV